MTPETGIDRLHQLVRDDLERVDALLLDVAKNDVTLIPEISKHLIVSGGKRLRPMLTLASARVCGYQRGMHHVTLAAAVECMHTATLLHDDVVDGSSLRRGQPSANALWDNKSSVLVGDYLIAQAFRLMVRAESLPVLDILSDAAATIAEGEVLQLATMHQLDAGKDAYFRVIAAKTAKLFAAACEVGAELSDQRAHRTALRTYGHALGMAFQLTDDALDYGIGTSEKRLGKAIGDDFRDAKVTLPVILAYAAADASERRFWERAFTPGQQQKEDWQQARQILARHQALEQTRAEAGRFLQEAAAALNNLPESQEKSALLEVLEFCAARTY
ncbi:MAG: polyprenyl synthetase family protein [Alphaproteobacteria bacterium]|nr:polyprenyl synthetase family protein [Alphaproteobacteria bacterium]